MKRAILTLGICVALMGIGIAYAYQPIPEEQPMLEYTVETVDEAVDELPTETIEIIAPEKWSDYCWWIYNECIYQDYNNPELAIAISRIESANFTSKAFKDGHNWGGLSVNEKPICYESDEEGCAAFIRLLKKYEELSVDELSSKWCPANPGYADLVKKIMKEIEVVKK